MGTLRGTAETFSERPEPQGLEESLLVNSRRFHQIVANELNTAGWGTPAEFVRSHSEMVRAGLEQQRAFTAKIRLIADRVVHRILLELGPASTELSADRLLKISHDFELTPEQTLTLFSQFQQLHAGRFEALEQMILHQLLHQHDALVAKWQRQPLLRRMLDAVTFKNKTSNRKLPTDPEIQAEYHIAEALFSSFLADSAPEYIDYYLSRHHDVMRRLTSSQTNQLLADPHGQNLSVQVRGFLERRQAKFAQIAFIENEIRAIDQELPIAKREERLAASRAELSALEMARKSSPYRIAGNAIEIAQNMQIDFENARRSTRKEDIIQELEERKVRQVELEKRLGVEHYGEEVTKNIQGLILFATNQMNSIEKRTQNFGPKWQNDYELRSKTKDDVRRQLLILHKKMQNAPISIADRDSIRTTLESGMKADLFMSDITALTWGTENIPRSNEVRILFEQNQEAMERLQAELDREIARLARLTEELPYFQAQAAEQYREDLRRQGIVNKINSVSEGIQKRQELLSSLEATFNELATQMP